MGKRIEQDAGCQVIRRGSDRTAWLIWRQNAGSRNKDCKDWIKNLQVLARSLIDKTQKSRSHEIGPRTRNFTKGQPYRT